MEPTRVDTLIGEKIRGYIVERKLGEGGFGTVYLAVNPTIERRAAVKVLHRECADSQVVIDRFISEARAVNKINHPNIIQVFDFDTLSDGRFYFMMEYIEGTELASLLGADPPLTLPQILSILDPVTRALEAAHLSGIVHRDLKPENIIVYNGWDEVGVKLLDFGIAKLSDTTGTERHTKTGQLLGTPAYMSPEQAKGEKDKVTHLSDVYSLGVITYELLSGTLPVKGDTIMSLLLNILTEIPKDLHVLVPGIPQTINDAVQAALAKDPAQRPQSAREFFEMLVAAADGAGIPAGHYTPRDISSAVTLDMIAGRYPTPAGQRAQTRPGEPDPTPGPATNPSTVEGSLEASTQTSLSAQESETPSPETARKTGNGSSLKLVVLLLALLVTGLTAGIFWSTRSGRGSSVREIPAVSWQLSRQRNGLENPLWVVVPRRSQRYQGKLLEKILYLDGEPRGLTLAKDDPGGVDLLRKLDENLHTLYAPARFLCRPEVIETLTRVARRHPVFIGLVPESGQIVHSCLNRLADLPLYLEIPAGLGPFWLVHLKQFKDLRGLILDGAIATDITLSYLRKQNGLEFLSLRNSAVTDKGLASLSRLFALRVLDLEGSRKIQGSGLAALSSLTHLEEISLAGTGVGDRNVQALAALPALASLNLQDCGGVTDRGVAALASAPSLRSLRVGGVLTVLHLEKDPLGTLGQILSLKENDFGLPSKGTSGSPSSLLNSKAARTLKGAFQEDKPRPSPITARGIAALARLRSLAHLSLGALSASPKELLTAISTLPSLETLHLSGDTRECSLARLLKTTVPRIKVEGARCAP